MFLTRAGVRGALHGSLAGAVYGVVETGFASVRPLVSGSYGYDVIPFWHWEAVGLLLLAYVAGGAILGAAGTLLLTLIPGNASEAAVERNAETAAVLSINLGYLANLAPIASIYRATSYAVAIALILIAILVWRLIRQPPASWVNAFADPLLTSVLLIGVPWIGLRHEMDHGALFSILLVAILSIPAFLLALKWPAHRFGRQGLALKSALVVAVVLPVLVVAGVVSGRDLEIPVAARQDRGSGRPNVLLIVMDTVRADHTSLYGYERDTTPELKRIARQATLYERFVATSNTTLPTHASMFTGLYPLTHGAHFAPPRFRHGRPLDDRFRTLAEILAENGYDTFGVVANAGYVSARYGLAQGFQAFDARLPVPIETHVNHCIRRSMKGLLESFGNTHEFDRMTLRAEDINRNVFRVLDAAQARKSPFFLFVNYMDGHSPYVPPAPFHRMFPGRDPSLKLDMSMRFRRAVFQRTHKLESREVDHLVSQYDGAIAYLDQQLGTLWARLEQQKLLDNTLVIITADHGEAFGEHDVIEHSVTLYRHQTFVPLLIKYPHQQQAAVHQQVTSQVDLLPTVLTTVGLAAPSGLPGHALTTEMSAPPSAVSEAYPHAVVLTWRPTLPRLQRSLTLDGSRFILSSNNTRELYAAPEDPKEQRNLCGADPARAKALEASLEAWLSQTVEYTGRPIQDIDPQTLERLKSLGYVQ